MSGVGVRTCPRLRGAESPFRDETNPAPQTELFCTAPGLGVHGEEVLWEGQSLGGGAPFPHTLLLGVGCGVDGHPKSALVEGVQ